MNYIGSKYSLLSFLETSIDQVVGQRTSPAVFCDIFAGTGAVGRLFKKKGYNVIANDLQYYSYVLNKQYIENHTILLFQGLESEIPMLKKCSRAENRGAVVCEYLEHITPQEGFVYKNFCKGQHTDEEKYCLYFSDENGKKCDAVREKIENWKQNGLITEQEYYFLLATLLENIDKVANTASVYGAFLKKIKKSAAKTFRMVPAPMLLNDNEHKVYNQDANQLIKEIKCDILYLDPPYNQRQYSANYHVLETIARYDNPILHGKTGMRDCSEQKSDYCARAKVLKAFDELIQNAQVRYIFLSYNNEGLMTLDDIERIMSKRGQYGRFEQQYSRFQADNESENRHIKGRYTTEYLHYVVIA